MRPSHLRSPRLRPRPTRPRTSASRRTPARVPVAVPDPGHAGPVASALTVDVCAAGRHPQVFVAGELDLASTRMLTAVLEHVRRSRPGPVHVDLSGVTFADSSGLDPVLGPGIVVTATSPAVRLVLAALAAVAPEGARSGR